jgi:hypothetical protein
MKSTSLLLLALSLSPAFSSPPAAADEVQTPASEALSSIPVSPSASQEKSERLAKLPAPVKPDEKHQLGSSVPVANPIWLDKPAKNTLPFVPHLTYFGKKAAWGLRSVTDGSSPQHLNLGGQATYAYLNCSEAVKKTCFEFRAAVGAGHKAATNTAPEVTQGLFKVEASGQTKAVIYEGSIENDFRFRKVIQSYWGAALASAKLHSSLRLSAGPGTMEARDAQDMAVGILGKAQLDSFLGRYGKLMLAFEGGKYTHDGARMRALAGLRVSTDQTEDPKNPRKLMYYVDVAAMFDKSTYKALTDASDVNSPAYDKRQTAVTGMASAGVSFVGF